MPKCDLCGAEVKEVFECKECGRFFGPECGDPKASLCNECKEFEIKERRNEEADIIDDLQDLEEEKMD